MVMKAMIDYLKKLREKLDLNARWIYITILGFILLFVLIVLPSSFAGIQPVKQIEIFSEKLNYNNGEPGAWKITKSAKWTSSEEAEITIDVDSVLKYDNISKDIFFVLDTSLSMEGERLDIAKSTIKSLMESFRESQNNRVGLITFDTTSEIISDITDSNSITEKIASIKAKGGRSYYQALESIENILKNYQYVNNRECTFIFIVGGIANTDQPNELWKYQQLKNKYPFVKINAIQYNTRSYSNSTLSKISDNQFIAERDDLRNVILDASEISQKYQKFEITNLIDLNNFRITDIKEVTPTAGKVKFNKTNQSVSWNLDSLNSGKRVELIIKVQLKDSLINKAGLYSLNKKTEISSSIDNIRNNIVNDETLTIANNYQVIYDVNKPDDCEVKDFPNNEVHFVYNLVSLSSSTPKCLNYQFKGWKITTSNVHKVNDSHFIMPESDVEVKGTWSKVKVLKSMNGTIGEAFTLYKQVEEDTQISSKYARKYVGDTSTFKGNKNVYYYYGKASNNNVIFASYCWKIVRTTDTGGVKLLYNGYPTSNGQCNNSKDDSQLTANQMNLSENKTEFNLKASSLSDAGYMYNENIRYETTRKNMNNEGTMMFGNSFTYQNGLYTLKNTISAVFSTAHLNLANYHYTCFNTSGTCATISYIYYRGTDGWARYINLSGGKSVEDVLNDMLYSETVNQNDSNIKKAIDYWYKNNMTGYTKYLEDTIWCNDRSMDNTNNNGWNPNGGSFSQTTTSRPYLVFGSANESSNNLNLICKNQNDRFTINNQLGNGRLKYPVGLITSQEQKLAFDSDTSPLASGNTYWGSSPNTYTEVGVYSLLVYETGNVIGSYTNGKFGVRPSVSLRADIEYSSGDGSINNPYIISTD